MSKSSQLSTDNLIEHLAESAELTPRFEVRPVLTTIWSLGIFALFLLTIVLLGLRANWSVASYAKFASLIFASLLVLELAIRNATPLSPYKNLSALWASLMIIALTTLGLSGEKFDIGSSFQFSSAPLCAGYILGLGGALFILLRHIMARAKPLRQKRFGAILGCLAGLIAASSYALFCDIDALAYLLTIYGSSVLSIGLLGAIFTRKTWAI